MPAAAGRVDVAVENKLLDAVELLLAGAELLLDTAVEAVVVQVLLVVETAHVGRRLVRAKDKVVCGVHSAAAQNIISMFF